MDEIKHTVSLIKAHCEARSLSVTSESPKDFRIFTGNSMGIYLVLNLESPENFNFHFLERTYDVCYNGDRSDAHVVLSLMFTSALRSLHPPISCALFDIAHPVIRNEIWGRYIMPQQVPAFLEVSSWEQVQLTIARLIEIVADWQNLIGEFASCPCDECCRLYNETNDREYSIPQEITFSLSKTFKSSSQSNYGGRARPNWVYYYDISNDTTVIKSLELSKYMEFICSEDDRKFESVNGITGKLILEGEIRNFISNKSSKILKSLLKSLGVSTKIPDYHILPMENMIVAVSSPYIIALGHLTGIFEFKRERELVRRRHNQESKILFPISMYEWEEEICPDEFEALIRALLEKEPNVNSVRRPAPVNQSDKGRDLIIEWTILTESAVSNVHPPTRKIKVVGQCKASKGSVGKSQVQDIRDTVETHLSAGFFLAVSSQITAPLTEKLENLKAQGIWTDWWNRQDIESRLSKNEDLIPLFPKVLRAKQKIKFVEKE